MHISYLIFFSEIYLVFSELDLHWLKCIKQGLDKIAVFTSLNTRCTSLVQIGATASVYSWVIVFAHKGVNLQFKIVNVDAVKLAKPISLAMLQTISGCRHVERNSCLDCDGLLPSGHTSFPTNWKQRGEMKLFLRPREKQCARQV